MHASIVDWLHGDPGDVFVGDCLDIGRSVGMLKNVLPISRVQMSFLARVFVP